MSVNTSIKEGGKGRSFGPVKCLMVQGDNGEFYPWYPEADRALDSLSVNKNGIYRASDRGVYGWNHVSVNVAQPDRVTGKDPETGQEVTVTTDPDTGELVETIVPVEIRIITPPTFIGPYGDGAYIDFSGLTVAAYDANGDKMQDVPFSEMIFPVTVTQYDPAAEVYYDNFTIDDQRYARYNLPIKATSGPVISEYLNPESGYGNKWEYYFDTGNTYVCGCKRENITAEYEWILVITRSTSGTFYWHYIDIAPSGRVDEHTSIESSYSGVTNISQTSFKHAYAHMLTGTYNLPTNIVPNDWNSIDVATILIDGIKAGSGGGLQIPVQWPRTGDGTILETSFGINVVDVSPNNNSGN